MYIEKELQNVWYELNKNDKTAKPVCLLLCINNKQDQRGSIIAHLTINKG